MSDENIVDECPLGFFDRKHVDSVVVEPKRIEGGEQESNVK